MDYKWDILFRRLNNLKYLRTIDNNYSLAQRLFLDTGKVILETGDLHEIETQFDKLTKQALVDAILGDWPPEHFKLLEKEEWESVCDKALMKILQNVPSLLLEHYKKIDISKKLTQIKNQEAYQHLLFLSDLPRAGYTGSDNSKYIPYPSDTNGAHSLIVTLYSIIIAQVVGIDIGLVGLLSFFHHLPNIILPYLDHEVELLIGMDNSKRWEEKAFEYVVKSFPNYLRDILISLRTRVNNRDLDDPIVRIFLMADTIDHIIQLQTYQNNNQSLGELIQNYSILGDGDFRSFQINTLKEFNIQKWEKLK